ncbi:hypothetical protein F4821DRAFT_224401 [Hypoxylon rubiginosum]|uniref:Uncharacterized protein n=1 Tax=Hypoxylon rubiginosum TaxID=110542 RepID=A0ACC0DII9_9PEZI|nr:hypothetical protein F4821DRAFT_224401 [Hypoxylon rubiginosum]
MKRKAPEESEDLNVPQAQRSRVEVEGLTQDADYYPDIDGDNDSEVESHHESISTAPVNNTPLTQHSPAYKWPSDFKTIKCPYTGCTKTFNRPARLTAHLRSHNNERPYACKVPGCGKRYIEEKHLRQHMVGSHSEPAHICPEPDCGKSFATATRLRRHQAVHQGQERFRCRDYPPCNRTFRKHKTLQAHIRSDHMHVSAFPCDFVDSETGEACGAGFDTSGGLEKHQERHHGEIRFWCDECNSQLADDADPQERVGFPTMDQLQTHIKQTHVNCMFCGLRFYGRANLEEHIESQHANTKKVKERKTVACTWLGCTKTFASASNMKSHLRSVHEGIRFVCGEFDLSGSKGLEAWNQTEGCGESFAHKSSLERHVLYVHLKVARPEYPSHASKAQPPPTAIEDLSIRKRSRRSLRCTVSGCNQKFFHRGELEAHIQSQHIIEQALLEQVGPASDPTLLQPASDPTLLQPASDPTLPQPMGFDDMMQEMTNLNEYDEGGQFWVGADNAGVGASTSVAGQDDEEWRRDEAEMKRLIPKPPYDLTGLVDPALERL